MAAVLAGSHFLQFDCLGLPSEYVHMLLRSIVPVAQSALTYTRLSFQFFQALPVPLLALKPRGPSLRQHHRDVILGQTYYPMPLRGGGEKAASPPTSHVVAVGSVCAAVLILNELGMVRITEALLVPL